MQATTRQPSSLARVRLSETVVLLAASWLVPFLVHLIPWAGARPLGVYLLPAFWTVFIAVYLFGGWVGALVALVTPVASLIVTGLPGLERVGPMGLELLGFVLCAAWFLRRWPTFVLVAPLSYLPAKALVVLVQWLVPAWHDARNPVEHFLATLRDVWPGLVVLLVINLLLVWLVPRSQPLSKGNQ
jgi:hypothetical protein